MTKRILCDKRTNPYDNIVYEYDTMTEGPEWDNFIEYIDDFDYSDADMDADVYLESMYDRINEGCKLYLQKKRQFQSEHEKVKRKFIPANVRKLIRRKDKLSKRILKSDS